MYSHIRRALFCYTSVALIGAKLAHCRPETEAKSEKILEAAGGSQYSSTVQKTYEQDVNVQNPTTMMAAQPIIGGMISTPIFSPIGYFGSGMLLGGRRMMGAGDVGTAMMRGGGGTSIVGGLGAVEQESHHLFREETEHMSRTGPIGGGVAAIAPVGVGMVHRDNTEKMFRKTSVTKPIIGGGILV